MESEGASETIRHTDIHIESPRRFKKIGEIMVRLSLMAMAVLSGCKKTDDYNTDNTELQPELVFYCHDAGEKDERTFNEDSFYTKVTMKLKGVRCDYHEIDTIRLRKKRPHINISCIRKKGQRGEKVRKDQGLIVKIKRYDVDCKVLGR